MLSKLYLCVCCVFAFPIFILTAQLVVNLAADRLLFILFASQLEPPTCHREDWHLDVVWIFGKKKSLNKYYKKFHEGNHLLEAMLRIHKEHPASRCAIVSSGKDHIYTRHDYTQGFPAFHSSAEDGARVVKAALIAINRFEWYTVENYGKVLVIATDAAPDDEVPESAGKQLREGNFTLVVGVIGKEQKKAWNEYVERMSMNAIVTDLPLDAKKFSETMANPINDVLCKSVQVVS